jgi:hypothetical protein
LVGSGTGHREYENDPGLLKKGAYLYVKVRLSLSMVKEKLFSTTKVDSIAIGKDRKVDLNLLKNFFRFRNTAKVNIVLNVVIQVPVPQYQYRYRKP